MNSHDGRPATLVVRPRRHADEPVAGYLLRLTDANGYESPKILLSLLEERAGVKLRGVHDLATRPEVLRAMESYTACGSLCSLARREIESAAGPYFRLHDTALPADALMLHHAQICPKCLTEDGYIHEEWELSAVTVCAKHRVALVDRCPACGCQLQHLRSPLVCCGACQFDLRRASVSKASAAEIVLAEHLSSLAPYRLRDAGQEVVDSPESLFGLVQLMAYPTQAVLHMDWREKHLQLLGAGERREAALKLASALDGYALDAERVRSMLREHVAHRLRFLPETLASEPLRDFVIANAFISPAARAVLLRRVDGAGETAAERFGGRPPQLHTEDEVVTFLGCSHEALKWLLRNRNVLLPVQKLGFDADELLAAKERLSQLVSFGELDACLGIAGLTRSLVYARALLPAPSPYNVWEAVDLVDLARLLDMLRTRAGTGLSTGSDNWVRVADIAVGMAQPAEAYGLVIARVLRGDVNSFDWRTPYSLTDLWLSSSDASRLMSASAIP